MINVSKQNLHRIIKVFRGGDSSRHVVLAKNETNHSVAFRDCFDVTVDDVVLEIQAIELTRCVGSDDRYALIWKGLIQERKCVID